MCKFLFFTFYGQLAHVRVGHINAHGNVSYVYAIRAGDMQIPMPLSVFGTRKDTSGKSMPESALCHVIWYSNANRVHFEIVDKVAYAVVTMCPLICPIVCYTTRVS